MYRLLLSALLLASTLTLLTGCDEYGPLQNPADGDDQCVSCHTDKELLKEVADPIVQSEGSGEG